MRWPDDASLITSGHVLGFDAWGLEKAAIPPLNRIAGIDIACTVFHPGLPTRSGNSGHVTATVRRAQ